MRRSGRLAAFFNRHAFIFFTLPSAFCFTLFFLVPLIRGIVYSFSDWNGLTRKYKYIWFDNYRNLFTSDRIFNSISFTAKYTIFLTVLTIAISLGLALLLNQKIRARAFFRTTYYFPAVLGMITVGMIWNQLFSHGLPYIGEKFGIESLSINILVQPNLAFYGILFVALWQGVATPTLLFLAGLQGVPNDLIEAARIDGASRIQVFKSVIVPFLIPVLNIVTILTLKSGITTFDYIMALTSGGPGRSTESIGYLVYNFAFMEFKFSFANALAVVLFIIICILSLIQIKVSSKYEVNK